MMVGSTTTARIQAPSIADVGGAVRALRGTNILASHAALRELGWAESYWQALPNKCHSELRAIVASDWVPMDLVDAHYRTLDGLVTNPREQREIGAVAGRLVRGTVVRTLARGLRVAAAVASVPPIWVGLERAEGLWRRYAEGGRCFAVKDGRRGAVLSIEGLSICAYPYVRNAFAGNFQSSLELVEEGVVVRCLQDSSAEKLNFQIRW